jgi:molybdenum cofactor guanylyltransferase
MKTTGITGIVMAGGRSSRMGTDKSLMLLRGKSLVQYAIDAIKPLCAQVVISANKNAYDFTGCEVWPDIYPIQAPMIGLYSCLKRSTTDVNIVVSCDMPLLQTSLFEHLLSELGSNDIVVPEHDNHMEPLCGIYRSSVASSLKAFIEAQNYKLHEFISASSHLSLSINPSHFSPYIFMNVNTLTEFNQLDDNLYTV